MTEETVEGGIEKTKGKDEKVVDSRNAEDLLVPLDDYLVNGVHVGLKYKTKDMEEFIYKVRPDKLCVFDVKKIDERLRTAGKFISSFEPEDILVVSNRVYGREPTKRFARYTGAKVVTKRFVSGTLTNPKIKDYSEPKLLIVTDPIVDKQAVKEAALSGIPILAICDTNTRVKGLDYVIPSNNKGKNSLALIYWILTKEVLTKKGEKFDAKLEEFISKAEPQKYVIEMQQRQRFKNRRKGKSGRGRSGFGARKK